MVIWNESGTRCTVKPDWMGIKAGETVDTEFASVTAPPEWGYYTLYEEVYADTHIHRSWVWIKEC